MLPGTQDAILLLPGDPTIPRASGGHLRGARAHVAKTPGSNGLRSPGLEESEVAATHVDCREAVGNRRVPKPGPLESEQDGGGSHTRQTRTSNLHV